MSEQSERRDQGAPQEGQPEGTEAPEPGSTERPRYTPPPYVPPVTLDKDRGNPTEPIPSNPTQPLPPGAPPRPGTFQQPAGGQPAAGQPAVGQQPPWFGQQPGGPAYPMQGYPGQQPYAGGAAQQPYPGQQPYPAQQPYPGLPGRTPYYAAPAPRGLSIAAMVCGISVFVGFGFLVLPQIAAVVLGHLGLAREPAGRGMALAGLVLGYVGIALTVAFLAVFILVLSMAPSRSGY
ncbi:DUF4190 domain-containing protein [Sinomonas sp. RB5]